MQAIVPALVPTANKQGNASKFLLASGSFTTGNCTKSDASGNAVDNAGPCGTAWIGGNYGLSTVPGASDNYADLTGNFMAITGSFCLISGGDICETIAQTGTLKNFVINLNSNQPADGTLVLSVTKNLGADTALSITIPANGSAGIYSDTAHTISVTRGDILQVHIRNNSVATPSAQLAGVAFTFIGS